MQQKVSSWWLSWWWKFGTSFVPFKSKFGGDVIIEAGAARRWLVGSFLDLKIWKEFLLLSE